MPLCIAQRAGLKMTTYRDTWFGGRPLSSLTDTGVSSERDSVTGITDFSENKHLCCEAGRTGRCACFIRVTLRIRSLYAMLDVIEQRY